MQFDISVVIVNYKTIDVIHDCLQSLFMQEGLKLDIIVVDNASTGETQHALAKYKNRITTIFNEDNHGFGQACNQGAAIAQAKFLYFLNPDSRLINKNDLRLLMSFAEDNTHFGIIGTQIVNFDGLENDFVIPKKYANEHKLSKALPALPGEIAYVTGNSAIIRKDLFTQVGSFDEDYFVYEEDIDLCLNIRKAGFSIGFFKDIKVKHLENASIRGKSNYFRHERLNKARYIFYSKHYDKKDVTKLIKFDLWKSRYRLLLLSLETVFNKSDAKMNRLDYYRSVLYLSKRYLQKGPTHLIAMK